MAGLGGLISNLISRGTSLLPTIQDSLFTPWSSSSSSGHESKLRAIEKDLTRMMRMLKRIQATLRDAERREIRDEAVQLWLTELREVAYAADDVLDEWRYEQIKAQVEARTASDGNFKKRRLILIPDGLADQIKKIRCRFNEICEHHKALQLREEDGVRILEAPSLPSPTSHLCNESSIFGRENEKNEVINLLLSDCNKNNLTILPIVGMGGLGKTTLAQLVYNDERFCQQFDTLGWIWVFNDFDVKRLTKAILESVTEYSSNHTELSLLQGELKTELASKRVFLVLDDVWNDQYSHWQSLMAPFFSAKRVSILVTTRNQSVALTTQTIPYVKLGALPDEQCWKIFQYYALSGFSIIKHQDVLELGRKIMNKCSGLPLAVKSIATLLRYENEERWEEILQSEIWGQDPKNEAFSALRISYIRLPDHLKSCLLFCSMFPKGYFYDENELIDLWIAQNYAVSRGKMSMEEVGSEFIRELRQRSFLDVANYVTSSSNKTYKIHDVVHDLLCLISKGAHRELHVDSPVHTTDDICYHLLVEGRSNLIDMHFMPKQLTMLRTLILRYRQTQALNDNNGHLVLPNIKKLRALEIFVRSEYYSPIPIGQMKHLRHLVLYNYNRDLESISQLFHLRSLLLCNCLLKELPKGFGNLLNLKSLSLSRCGIKCLPESFSLHSKLEKLGIWFCHKLEILPKNLGKLVNLRELRIDECPLQALPDSMSELGNLKSLTIDCSDNNLKLPEAIGNLLNLQELSINAQIDHLPPSFNKLYNNCRSTRLHHVVVGESGGVGWLRNFENFKGTLCFKNLSNLVDLDEVGQNILVAMHNLEGLVLGWDSHLYVIKEPSMRDKNVLFVSITRNSDRMPSEQMSLSILESLQPHRNLKRLAISNYPGNMLPAWMGDSSLCASLQTINLHFCYNLCSLSFGNLGALRNFRLWGPEGLSSLPEDSLPPQLEKLDIYNGYNLISMPVLLRLVSLVELRISSCYKLRPFVMESDHDTKGWLPPTSCSVEIQDCPLLKDWCLQQGIHYEESWRY
ncbi:hypothetical protein LUZ61_000358 [Rhynchospora tenuis]|uniref:Uncharacterized protein n=1 Tax=Rhynchospora tenuis TaxID=198213 RepID=A0AAD5ZF73_9POAL|nr:hypothetical protein LUZ61_000358 [Rhynchospora tenuis]